MKTDKDKLSKTLHEHRTKVKKLLRDTNVNYILVGLLLAKGVQEKYHAMLDYKRVEDYWEHEYGIKASTGWNYVGVANWFAPYVKEGVVLPDITRLIKLLPIIVKCTPAQVDKWWDAARSMSPKDFNKELLISKGKPDQDQCLHEQTELWQRCKTCGRWLAKQEDK